MPNRQEQHHRSPRDVPPVGRPKGAVWRSLQADGVVWEGQVLLVGGEVDLAARMIVTHRRVVFVRGGDVVLEIPRGWLRQEPVLRRDGVLELFVATPDSNPFDEPMPVQLRMKEGHPAAGHIIAMLAPGGVRRIAPDAVSAIERARNAAPTPTYGGFWDGVDPIPAPKRDELTVAARHLAEDNGYEGSPGDLPPLEPPDLLVRAPSSPRRQPTVPAYTIAGLAPRDQRRSPWWLVLRICALLLLLGTAAALGAGRLNIAFPGSSPGAEAVLTAPPSDTEPEAQPVASSEAESAPDSANASLSPDDLTAVAVGVGGPSVQPNQGSTVAQAPSESSVTATAAPVMAPTEAAIPTPAPAVEEPVTAEVQEPVNASTEAAAAPEESAAAPEAAESPAAPEQSTAPDQGPAASAAIQPAAVPENGMPAQEIVVGPVRMAIPTALRAESLPKYGLPPGDGEWVLLVTELTNEGDTATTLAMSDFRLFDRGIGRVADLDSGVGVIATLAGMATSRNASESISLDPGASTEALLLFLLPPGSSDDLALLVGESALDLAPSLAASDGEPAARPELLEATVTQVHGGDRITVDIDGLSRVVRYLGVQAPAADACFAAESAAANSQLVEGKTIWLERQATDIGADGELMRDVWVADAQGERVLVGARLLEAGAAEPHSVAPDTRYQSWLSASSALGRTNGAGLWGLCPGAGTSEEPPAATQLGFMPGGWRAHMGLAAS